MNKKELAKEEIKKFFEKAEKTNNQELANDYVRKARKLAMKFTIRLPKELKRKFCKHCYGFFRQGKNVRVRNNKSSVTYYCLKCKKYMRFPLK